jgi:aryl-alcohol dehydrogenase-like predicted oxidoreductase
MRYARLGGVDVSVVALGCGNFGGIGSAPDMVGRGDTEVAAFALMDAARDAGITLFDTANAYGLGASEAMIGRWLAARPGARDEIVLTTKVRNRMPSGDEGLSAGQVRVQIDASLRRLGTDRVDFYLAHEPDDAVPLAETLDAFDELVRAGKVRHTGLSNYTGAEFAAAASRVANLQNGYSLLDRSAAADFAGCARHGVGFTAFSPLAGGWLTGKYRAGQEWPAGSRMTLRPGPYAEFVNGSATYRKIDLLTGLAGDRGLSLPTAALAWVLTDPGVTSAIIGPRTPEQLVAACAAADVTMSGDERAAFAAVEGSGL